jgi:FMN reductase
MKHVTIIATSLDEESKSQMLAKTFEDRLNSERVSCERIDLRTLDLPFAGSSKSWDSNDVKRVKRGVERASHIVFSVPIYCYDVNAAAKNVIELVGRAFTKKVVGFICSAGGRSSYMSVMAFANHLMLDFRSLIVPRFLYVDDRGWADQATLKPEIENRMQVLVDDLREIQVTVEKESPVS